MEPPATLPEAYRAAWRHVVKALAADPVVLGATIGGSVVRGEGQLTSDLDVYVLVSGGGRWRRTYVCEGVLVEEFRNPEGWIRHYLAQGEDAPAFSMLGHGVVVVDRHPAFAGLCEEARERLAAGPPALGAEAAIRQRYLVWDAWCDVRDLLAAGSGAQALGLMQREVHRALEAHHHLRGRWYPKGKRLLAALSAWDPGLAREVQAFWAGPFTEANSAFRPYDRIVRHVLAPHDPDRPLVWESARQPLPPL